MKQKKKSKVGKVATNGGYQKYNAKSRVAWYFSTVAAAPSTLVRKSLKHLCSYNFDISSTLLFLTVHPLQSRNGSSPLPIPIFTADGPNIRILVISSFRISVLGNALIKTHFPSSANFVRCNPLVDQKRRTYEQSSKYTIKMGPRNSHVAAFRAHSYASFLRSLTIMTGVISTSFFVVTHKKARSKGTGPAVSGWGWGFVPFFGPSTPPKALL